MMMSSGVRKAMLAAHVIASIGWFGAVGVFLALALVGMMSQDPQMVRAAYLVMGLTTWGTIIPFALLALVTGIVSSLFTRWGLFRSYWVLLKLVMTVVATLVLLAHTQPIDALVGVAERTGVFEMNLFDARREMVLASAAALLVLLVATILSVYKPRGLTPYGQRKLDEQRQEFITDEREQGSGIKSVPAVTVD